MTSDDTGAGPSDTSPPTQPPDHWVPLAAQVLGVHREDEGGEFDWTVVLSVLGPLPPHPLRLAAVVKAIREMFKEDPVGYIQASAVSIEGEQPKAGERFDVAICFGVPWA